MLEVRYLLHLRECLYIWSANARRLIIDSILVSIVKLSIWSLLTNLLALHECRPLSLEALLRRHHGIIILLVRSFFIFWFMSWLTFYVFVCVVHLREDALARLHCHTTACRWLSKLASLLTEQSLQTALQYNSWIAGYYRRPVCFFIGNEWKLRWSVVATLRIFETRDIHLSLLVGAVAFGYVESSTFGVNRVLILVFQLDTFYLVLRAWLYLLLTMLSRFLRSSSFSCDRVIYILHFEKILLLSLGCLALN